MLVKPQWLLDRDLEWQALGRFVERRQRLAVVYGPRRVGKSYLLDAICEAAGGYRYQAITGVVPTQLDDFGRTLGAWLGVGPLRLSGWADALERLARTEIPLVVIDELPYLMETTPELTSLLQRYVDAPQGPSLVLAGSSLSTMAELVTARAPLYGRSAAVAVPAPFAGGDLAELWGVRDPARVLWVDAAVGGLPGYRPLLEPPGPRLDAWMVEEVLAPSSPLLDAAEVTLVDTVDMAHRGIYRAILAAIAAGDQTFSAIARVIGRPSGSVTRPLAALERAGLVTRVADPLRSRRDRYDLADPHLRMWLGIIAPHRSRLQAGHAEEVWAQAGDTTWRAQILGPRWEAVARAHVARFAAELIGPVERVGVTTVSDRVARTSHEVDIVAARGRQVVALGEAKLRRLGAADLDRLRRIRDLLGAERARIVLASADGVEPAAARSSEVITVTPADVYG